MFALPRGGVPVAYPVAKELQAPLDVLVSSWSVTECDMQGDVQAGQATCVGG